MSRTITKKQKKFADKYLDSGNGAVSALHSYNTQDYNTAAVIANENLKKPNVIEYLKSQAQAAAERVIVLAESAENETVRLNANKDILDRSGYKAVDKVLSTNVNINTNLSETSKYHEIKAKYEKELEDSLNE
jgi:phage terminase small subunit